MVGGGAGGVWARGGWVRRDVGGVQGLHGAGGVDDGCLPRVCAYAPVGARVPVGGWAGSLGGPEWAGS